MKKTTAILLFITLIFCFTACDGKLAQEKEIPKADEYEWVMRFVQKIDGNVVIYGTDKYTPYENAKETEMTATAKDGIITVTDITKGKTYEGTYIKSGKTPDSINYKFTLEGTEGYGMTAMTKYFDGETYYETPTMIISLDGYNLTFEADNR